MCLNPINIQGTHVPCGKCIECEQRRANEWAFRVMLEAKNKDSFFLTLTYDDEHLPANKSVSKRVAQNFIKSLRQEAGIIGIKYIGCGEYGDFVYRTGRPHYHFCFLGWKPEDLLQTNLFAKGYKRYTSKTISKIWKNGFHVIEDVNEKSARYICKYMQKFIFNIEDEEVDSVAQSDDYYLSKRDYKRIVFKIKYNVEEPFFLCSKGIGYQVWKNDPNFESDKIYSQGRYLRIPRYFILKYKKDILKTLGLEFEPIIDKRFDDLIFSRRREKLKTNQLQDYDEERKKDVLKKFFSKKYVKNV